MKDARFGSKPSRKTLKVIGAAPVYQRILASNRIPETTQRIQVEAKEVLFPLSAGKILCMFRLWTLLDNFETPTLKNVFEYGKKQALPICIVISLHALGWPPCNSPRGVEIFDLFLWQRSECPLVSSSVIINNLIFLKFYKTSKCLSDPWTYLL